MKNKKSEMRRRNRERRKHRTLKEMLRERRNLLTDEEVFTSPQMNKYLHGKVKLAVKDFGRKVINIKIYYNPFMDSVACTNNSKILVNAGHPIFTGTREEKFKKIMGACAHETAHYLFTNFTATNEWISGIENGTLIPAFPTFNETGAEERSVLLENSEKVKDFLEGKIGCTNTSDPAFTNREWISRAGFAILNILEDGRVENLFSMYCSNHRSLYYGLIDLIAAQRDACPTLPELLDDIDSGKLYEFEVFESVLLHYVRFGEIQGYVHKEHKDEPFMKSLYKIIPYVDEYLDSMDSYTCLTCLNKIIIALWPDIEKLINDINEALENAGEPQEAGPERMSLRSVCVKGQSEASSNMEGEGTDGEEFNKAKPGANKSPCPSPSKAEAESEEEEAEDDDSSDEDEDAEDDDSSDEDEDAEDDDSSDEDEDAEDDDSSDEDEDAEDDDSSDEDEDAEDDDSSLEELPDWLNPFFRTSDILDALTDGKKHTNLDINELMEQLATDMNEELEKREVENDFMDLNSDIDYGKIHEGVTCSFVRPVVTEENRREYMFNKQAMEKLVKEMIRKSTFLENESDPLEFKNKYSGRRFNASATAKKDYRFFSREAHIEPNYELDVIILCDESGSMSGSRIEACKATALCCYEFMQRACGPGHVAVYGHSTDFFGYSSREGHVKLFCYADFDNPDENDKYRIMNMAAGGSNRDGYALRYVKEKIAERDAERKLIITISDGQPADTGYGGIDAVRDIQSVLRECERENIMYIAAAIGSDLDVIKSIYGAKHFLNLANLSELPNRLMSLIARLLK